MARQVAQARAIQQKRFAGMAVSCNARMSDRMLQKFVELDAESRRLLEHAMETLSMSPRAYTRIKKLSRTIADLAGSERVTTEHLLEAIGYRALDRANA